MSPDDVPEGIAIEVATDEAIQAAVCRSDPLAQRKQIPLADLAERGLGVAIVPASVPARSPRPARGGFRPELRGRLVLAWRATGPVSPAARVLIDRARRLLNCQRPCIE